ncbi:MAG: class I SAM-dependent methyltransferase [Myxococcaceae bacterium]|nr:class I SAM-dependent methyltransferase [Myxococcaceae bacterium]MCA3015231.1 class I SAM-dependent methyltransferase [Myxococcaceae bacterium]
MATEIKHCRVCGNTALEPILSLGDMPPVNSFLTGPQDFPKETFAPLAIVFCAPCGHVQLTHQLDPKDVFTDYIYFSAMSETVVRWGQQLAARYAGERSLQKQQLVAELASNDGCILKPFRDHCRVLGVEPAKNIAEVANKDGVPTVAEFFNFAMGQKLRAEHGPAELIMARNVLAHVPDLVDFVKGVHHWLSDDGIFHVEVPYLRPMVDHLEFDTIYHEHLSYFSVTALHRLFREAGLTLWDVEEIPLHGGSLIARGKRSATPKPSVAAYLEAEKRDGYTSNVKLHAFADGTRKLKTSLPEFLHELKKQGPLAAYGAAAKGVVLTNYCRIGTDLLSWVADRSPYKQGKLTPGMHLPVVPAERVKAEQPKHLVVLAWNFFDEIVKQQDAYRQAGGKFVVPVPSPQVR